MSISYFGDIKQSYFYKARNVFFFSGIYVIGQFCQFLYNDLQLIYNSLSSISSFVGKDNYGRTVRARKGLHSVGV